MIYKNHLIRLCQRVMLVLWAIFLITLVGLWHWTSNGGVLEMPRLGLELMTAWRIEVFILGMVTMIYSFRLFFLGQTAGYWFMRFGMILAVSGLAMVLFRLLFPSLITDIGAIVVATLTLLGLFWLADRVQPTAIYNSMLASLPPEELKLRIVAWPPIGMVAALFVVFGALGAVVFTLVMSTGIPWLHQSFENFFSSQAARVVWWSFTVIGLVELWHWLIVGVYLIAMAVPSGVRLFLYCVCAAILGWNLYIFGIPLNESTIIMPLALMVLVAAGEHMQREREMARGQPG